MRRETDPFGARSASCKPSEVRRAFGIVPILVSALAHVDVCIVHNDGPRWRELTMADFQGRGEKSPCVAAASCAARR